MATIIYKNSRTYRKKPAFVFYDFLKQPLFYIIFLTIAKLMTTKPLIASILQKVLCAKKSRELCVYY